MIPQRELAPWRAKAPWASDLMVEQDYLINMIGYLPSGVSYDPHNACADFLRVFLPHLAE